MTPAVRIAMWSGPRNISTAMMRSWGNRRDAYVSDEPLYAHYLKVTGLPHPGASEVIAHHDSDWRSVLAHITGPIPDGKTVWYQKHMAHHLLPEHGPGGIPRSVFVPEDGPSPFRHAFLIRDPAEMLTSLIKVTPSPTLRDTGLAQQMEIYDLVQKHTGVWPPVVDAKDVLENPRGVLGALCRELRVEFDEGMLSWPAGRRDTDGIWAKHWYGAVEASTEFGPYTRKIDPVPPALELVLDQCRRIYDWLHSRRLTG